MPNRYRWILVANGIWTNYNRPVLVKCCLNFKNKKKEKNFHLPSICLPAAAVTACCKPGVKGDVVNADAALIWAAVGEVAAAANCDNPVAAWYADVKESVVPPLMK